MCEVGNKSQEFDIYKNRTFLENSKKSHGKIEISNRCSNKRVRYKFIFELLPNTSDIKTLSLKNNSKKGARYFDESFMMLFNLL